MDDEKRKEISDYADSRAICGDVITARYLRECVDHVCAPQTEFTDEQILEAANSSLNADAEKYDSVSRGVYWVYSDNVNASRYFDDTFVRAYFAKKAKQELEVPQYLIDAFAAEYHSSCPNHNNSPSCCTKRALQAVLRAQQEHADA